MDLKKIASVVDEALKKAIKRISKIEKVPENQIIIMSKLEEDNQNPTFHLMHQGIFLRTVKLSELADFGKLPLKAKVITVQRAVKQLYKSAKKWLKVDSSKRISITLHLSKDLGQLVVGHFVDEKPVKSFLLYDSLKQTPGYLSRWN